jgi:hypothetical protein
MAYTTINKSSAHFDVKLWTGNGSSQTITGYEFQPDLAWIKARTSTGWHDWTDAVRGATKSIFSNSTDAEDTSATSLTAFTSDGYSFGTNSQVNGNGTTYVGWNWKANGAGSANTDGSINTTATSANTTAGFSIVKYTGTGSNATIGHGLGVAPKMIIVKNLTDARSWGVYHASLGATQGIDLDGTGAAGSASSYWNDTAPTTSVFSIGTANNTGAAQTYVAYCFAEKTGFSKFGSYTGNGNADGPFIYTGFKPQFILWKRTDSANGWILMDTKRSPFNVVDDLLEAQSNGAEATASSYYVDYLSNGFKIRNTNNVFNNSSGTYIFMAFAEAPLVGSNNVPATAR